MDNQQFIIMDKTKLKCVRNPGEILYADEKHSWIIDQLDPSGEWSYYKSYFPAAIQSGYGLTTREYYNIVVKGDINYQPKCANPDCDNDCYFINLRSGYSNCCCNSCHISWRNYKDWKNPEYREFHKELNQYTINGWKGKSNLMFKLFISNNYWFDTAYFYIGLTEEVLKYGITTISIEDRRKRNGLKSNHLIYKGTVYEVALLERLIKQFLKDSSEWLEVSQISNLFKIVKSCIKVLPRIINSSTIERVFEEYLSRVDSSESK